MQADERSCLLCPGRAGIAKEGAILGASSQLIQAQAAKSRCSHPAANSSWGLWWAVLSSPTPSIQSKLYLQNISATNSINSPNFWHFRLCQLMGMRCPRFTRSPAESCLKLSRFENSILEADKNSARFHTVPVEAGGTDGSLQAA